MPEPKWFMVRAAFCVQADSDDDAIDVIARAIRQREHPGRGMGTVVPVGTFNAEPTQDPTAAPGRGPTL
jgi:hypothetical protein